MSDHANTLEDIFLRNRSNVGHNEMLRMRAKCTQIMMYDNLPLTIPKRVFEDRLQSAGSVIVYEYDGALFCTAATPNALPDANGENRAVSFVHLGKNLTRTIGIDAVQVRNDSLKIGLLPILNEYCSLMAQAKLTWYDTLVNLRQPFHIQALDADSQKSALAYEKARRAGDTTVLYAENMVGLPQGVEFHSTPAPAAVSTQVIEISQYIISHYYGELGVTINNNMKSQYVNEAEIQKSTGIPLVNDMLNCRLEGMRDIEALFGVTITVQTSEAWSEGKVSTDEEQVPAEDGAAEEAAVAEGSAEGTPEPAAGGPASDDAASEGEVAAEAEGSEADAVDETPAVQERETATKAEVIGATVALTEVDVSVIAVGEEAVEEAIEENVEDIVADLLAGIDKTSADAVAEISLPLRADVLTEVLEEAEDKGLDVTVLVDDKEA